MQRDRNRILIVDDSKTRQVLLKSLLRKSGFTVYVTETVSEGLKFIGTENIGIVLVDFFLAGINNGTALVNKIKKYGVDVEIYSISGSEENSMELLSAGCNGVLPKDPAEISKFLSTLKDI